MYKGEIRDSTINSLIEKAAKRNYGRYLAKMILKKLRGFINEPVSFDFPVTAIIGPNGGAKQPFLVQPAARTKAWRPSASLQRAESTTRSCKTGLSSTNS
jgi:hypothetical protein